MAGQHPKEYSQYFRKKALHKIHHPFFLSRLVLDFYLITAQSLLLFLLQTSFTFFLVSSAGSWPDCSCPPFQCHSESPREFPGPVSEPKSLQCEWESCVGWMCHFPITGAHTCSSDNRSTENFVSEALDALQIC